MYDCTGIGRRLLSCSSCACEVRLLSREPAGQTQWQQAGPPTVEECGFLPAWESIHVVQVDPEVGGGKRAVYKLNTTVMLSVNHAAAAAGATNLSGNMSSNAVQTLAFAGPSDHLVNLGRMIEKMENDIRSNIDGRLLLMVS